MTRKIASAHGHHTMIVDDNLIMKRTWAELVYTVVSFPLVIAAFSYILLMIENGLLWAFSASGVRAFGSGSRILARNLLGEDVPAPPRLQSALRFKVETPDAKRLEAAVIAAGGKAREWETKPGLTVRKLPQSRIAELATEAGLTSYRILPTNAVGTWLGGRIQDPVSWRARAYFTLKLPLAVIGTAASAIGWLGGLYYLTFPIWWSLRLFGPLGWFHFARLADSFALVPLGAALLLAGPWLVHRVTEVDRYLIRNLLGPSSPAERIRALEESRARAVDDSAARLRTIERDLHDGTQAQLVALAMKLGLAKDKLEAGDLARVSQLVDDAHRGIIEAIADLRILARGIHPPVLDNGLADALATLANRSSVPVELIADTSERPSDAIETIAYFSAAELLTNVAKHSGAPRTPP